VEVFLLYFKVPVTLEVLSNTTKTDLLIMAQVYYILIFITIKTQLLNYLMTIIVIR
jgi:hypothetical protein